MPLRAAYVGTIIAVSFFCVLGVPPYSPVPTHNQVQLQQLAHRVLTVYSRLLSADALNMAVAPASTRTSDGPPSSPLVAAPLRAQLYDNWVLDVPKLLDIAALYGSTHTSRCRQLMAMVFEVEERYSGDLAEAMTVTVRVVNDIVARSPSCGTDAAADESGAVLSTQDWQSVLAYLVDITSTLVAFADVFPDSCYIGMPSSGSCLLARVRVCERVPLQRISLPVRGFPCFPPSSLVCSTFVSVFSPPPPFADAVAGAELLLSDTVIGALLALYEVGTWWHLFCQRARGSDNGPAMLQLPCCPACKLVVPVVPTARCCCRGCGSCCTRTATRTLCETARASTPFASDVCVCFM